MILAMLIAILGLETHAAIYIVGDSQFCNWDPAAGIPMTDNGDGTYSYTATISGIAYFVFADGLDSDWTTFNSQYRYGPGINDESVPENMWVNTQKTNSNGAYYVNFNWDPVKYEITFDEINKRFKIESEAIIPFSPYGDLNGDGSVNIADITALIDCIIEHDQDLNYDFDEDGSVGIADVTSLIDYILQGANLSSLAVARALLAAPRQLQASLHCARLAQEFPPQLP